MVSTASTSDSGPIPSLAATTTPFTPSATGPLFSYRMPSSSTSPVLSYSTSQTSGLGAGKSNAPLQGHMGGTPAPFNALPNGGGHIPPSSPSLNGMHQQSLLPVRYNDGTELLINFSQTKADHISDHIQEWRHRKSLIKVPVPPAFLLEWFIKSLVPQLSKDVATSRVFSEEDTIMRAQQLELIYSQSGLLYEIFPDVPCSILDNTRQRVGPHVNGIVGQHKKSMLSN
jgi:hypothetical protein